MRARHGSPATVMTGPTRMRRDGKATLFEHAGWGRRVISLAERTAPLTLVHRRRVPAEQHIASETFARESGGGEGESRSLE